MIYDRFGSILAWRRRSEPAKIWGLRADSTGSGPGLVSAGRRHFRTYIRPRGGVAHFRTYIPILWRATLSHVYSENALTFAYYHPTEGAPAALRALPLRAGVRFELVVQT